MGGGSPTIRGFFVQQGQSSTLSGFSTVALRVKASALFEGANRLSSSWSPRESLVLAHRRRRCRPLYTDTVNAPDRIPCVGLVL